MKKIFRVVFSFLCASCLALPSLGAFPGSDKYTKEEYEKAGIRHTHYKLWPDSYIFCGTEISQELAEKLTSIYQNAVEDNGNPEKVYSHVASGLISFFFCYIKKNKDLSYENSILSLENIRLQTKISNLEAEIKELRSGHRRADNQRTGFKKEEYHMHE